MLDGPMWAARVYMMVHEMGPFQCLRMISFCAAVGQLKLINNSIAFALRANLSTGFGSYPAK